MSKGIKTYQLRPPYKFVFDIYVDTERQNEKHKIKTKTLTGIPASKE